jgi:hypothetical protein
MELANFFEVLAKQGGAPPQFLGDYPNPGNRSAAIAKNRFWPRQKHLSDTQSFVSAKKQAGGVKSYSAQEISMGPSSLWAGQNVQSGRRRQPRQTAHKLAVSAELWRRPDVPFDQSARQRRFTEIHRRIQHFLSFRTTAPGQNSITIAPAGVNQNAIAYGIIVSTAQDANAGSLDQVAEDLIQNLQQSNPGMRQNGDMCTIEVNGVAGRSVELASDSPLQQSGKPLPERDWLVVAPGPGGAYLYLIFIAPERDFGTLNSTYQRTLDSLRVE